MGGTWPRFKMVTCSRCHGNGRIDNWNKQMPQIDCPRCDGIGRLLGVRVLEVDPWTSTGNLTSYPWRKLRLMKNAGAIEGGDAAAARAIFGGHWQWYTATRDETPPLGRVWYAQRGGRAELYRTNYDSSD